MKKAIGLIQNKLRIEYEFTEIHKNALLIVFNNRYSVEFENRWGSHRKDLDGNNISWVTCDELVEMGLLEEDELSENVTFKITEEGKYIIENYLKTINNEMG